jgi:hypothetical protein
MHILSDKRSASQAFSLPTFYSAARTPTSVIICQMTSSAAIVYEEHVSHNSSSQYPGLERLRAGKITKVSHHPLPGRVSSVHEDSAVAGHLFGNVARIISSSSPLSAGF